MPTDFKICYTLRPGNVQDAPKTPLVKGVKCARMAEKNWKSEKMGAKFVRTTSTIYKWDERKLLPQHFTPCTVDMHPYKNILLSHYRVPRKTFEFVPVVPKAHGRANVCVHRKSIKRCNSKNVLGAFYRGWYVVVQPYSNFSLRHQMVPVESIKFQMANFPIFCTRIIVIFWSTCIARKVFSLVKMGNGKQVLPLLQWLKVVIAFVSSYFLRELKRVRVRRMCIWTRSVAWVLIPFCRPLSRRG